MSENVSLTAKQLQDLIATAVTAAVKEAKKPEPLSEQETATIAMDQQMRAEQSQLVLSQIDAKRMEQRICSHKHGTGQSHCVFILDGNYILCQKCFAKIRPGVAPKGYQGGDIYDLDLFNRVWQECQGHADM